MKKPFAILTMYFLPLIMFGQEFDFSEIIELNNLRSSESLMYKKELRNISSKDKYYYEAYKHCDDSNISCDWDCRQPIIGSYVSSNFQRNDIKFEYYSERKETRSQFVRNYNSKTKKATTFIDIVRRIESDNLNCIKTFKTNSEDIVIGFQFNNKEDFYYLKNEIITNSEFSHTNSYASPTEAIYRYKQETKIINDQKKEYGIYFTISEGDTFGNINIAFNKSFYEPR
jgi:hypothetical protein